MKRKVEVFPWHRRGLVLLQVTVLTLSHLLKQTTASPHTMQQVHPEELEASSLLSSVPRVLTFLSLHHSCRLLLKECSPQEKHILLKTLTKTQAGNYSTSQTQKDIPKCKCGLTQQFTQVARRNFTKYERHTLCGAMSQKHEVFLYRLLPLKALCRTEHPELFFWAGPVGVDRWPLGSADPFACLGLHFGCY